MELHQEQYALTDRKRIYFPLRFRPAFVYAVCDDEEDAPIMFVLYEEVELLEDAA